MDTQRINITELSSDPANARKHSQRNIEAIASSLRRFGQQKPIVVDKSNVVRAGNGTLEAARHLGWDQIDVVFTNLESSEATAFAIADNRTAELAEWNDDVLAASLQGLDKELQAAAGYEGKELDQILSTLDTADVVEDEVPEPPAEPKTKLGDLWILGRHRLLCGDSTDESCQKKLMQNNLCNLVVTDPPYALFGNSTGVCVADDKMIRPFFRDIGKAIFSNSKPGSHFYSCLDWKSWAAVLESYQQAGLTIKNMIVWDKKNAALGQAYRSQHELLMFGIVANQGIKITKSVTVKKDSKISDTNVWSISRQNKEGLHAALKPQELLLRAINNSSKRGDLVLDLFGGSGSTLIACETSQRRCSLMELSPQYCDVIVKRWQNLTGKEARRDGT